MPTAIWAEVQRLPVGFLEQVIEYRAYANAKAAVDAATTREAMQHLRGEMVEMVTAIEFELVREASKSAQ